MSKKILNDAVIFCADPLNEYFHLFVISSAAKGEMKTRGYDYQDPANNDPWFRGDGDFGSVIKRTIKSVRDNALQET